MMREFAVTGLIGMVLLTANAQTGAQTRSTTKSSSMIEGYSDNGRRYLVKFDEQENLQEGGWGKGNQLRQYAEAHPGSYILFTADGSLYRLSDAKQLKEVAALYGPLRQLGKQQEALGSVQRPLGAGQRALGEEMQATHDPATKGHIGAEQGSLGQVQGEVGRQQGELGRQQGILGAALNDHIQAMIDTCLRDKSCPVVEAAKT